MREAKAALRAAALARRAALDPQERAAAAIAAGQRLVALPEFQRSRTIAFYWAVRDELPTQGAIAAALAAGQRVALPRVARTAAGERAMVFHAYGGDPAELRAGPLGLMQPRRTAPVVAPGEVDLAVVPGVAFDRTGGRVGYGGGYYDRYLPRLAPGVPKVGFCYAVQLVGAPVPRGPADVAVDALITENEVLRF